MSEKISVSISDAPLNLELFFPWLKEQSEKYWATIELKRNIYGFQIQPGTKWNPGLTDIQIDCFEKEIGFSFPAIYRLFLKHMNGTDKPCINIYAYSGTPFSYSPGYYTYPKDLAQFQELIQWIYESKNMSHQEIEKEHIPHILPIVSHRFLVMDRCGSNPVLSMYGDDIIPYANDLRGFLLHDIFRNGSQDPNLKEDLQVDFWL
jgi:hypothetical protein